MKREEIWLKLNKIFASLFGEDEAKKINDESQAKDVRGWDSLAHMDLLERIEKDFSVRLTYREIASFEHVKDIVDCLERKLN